MNDIISIENITGLIYLIRGKKVMLDRDLAQLYDVETKVFKQAVRRNIERFPEDFMFELSKSEFINWRSQFVTSSRDKMGLRYSPMVFTEQGVAMLSGVLRSKTAIHVNIQIMRAFTKMRIVFETLDQLLIIENKPKKKIGFMAKEKQAEYGKRGNRKKWENRSQIAMSPYYYC